ncbi:MAG TPA: xylulokinase [Steroidobacteraceae bacterium]|jgi:xylulokinase|nr:xylulokinase [Steroidobacteraceae bacterium]
MYLGIDLGTSSVKCVIVDDAEAVIAQASAPLAVSRPQPLFSEQDAADWWRATVESILRLPASARASVRSIGLSGQMHGATLLDHADVPLRPAILWNDGRSAAECRELEQREPRARSITGNIMMPGFTAPKLAWVAHHEPELFARTATVLLPKDYLRLQLTGERVSEMSDASGTGWLDVAQRDWSDAMLAATSLSRANMPRLVEGNAVSGRVTVQVAEQLGIRRVSVAGGAGDNAASAVGMGIIAPGQAFLSLGTSGVLFAVTDRFRPNPERAAHAFCHALPGCWHQMAVLLSAASALDWIAQLLGATDLVQLVEAAQARGLRRESPYFLPYLSGERTPHNNPLARGVFFGLTHETTPPDLVTAVLEGVALAVADGQDVLLESGGQIDEISMTGGGARLAYWGQLLAAALNRPLTYRAGSEIGAALGAARLGRMAVTGERPASVCRMPPIVRVIAPDRQLAPLLAQRRGQFRNLYRDLRNLFQESAA